MSTNCVACFNEGILDITGNSCRIIIVEANNVFARYDTFLCKNCFSKRQYCPSESERITDTKLY